MVDPEADQERRLERRWRIAGQEGSPEVFEEGQTLSGETMQRVSHVRVQFIHCVGVLMSRNFGGDWFVTGVNGVSFWGKLAWG
jgi:hypothetical protein